MANSTLHMRYFIAAVALCLTFQCTSAFWYRRRNRHTNRVYIHRVYEHFDYGLCECGKKNNLLSSRIIGGQEVFEYEFPWMAGIISVNKSETICGASIINDRYVVSAAHCTSYGFDENDLKVSVGTHNSCKWDAKTTIFSIDSIFRHPSYDNQTNFADIMLIKLVMSITFNQFVRPICLPKIGTDILSRFGNQSVSALGWGFSENDSLFSNKCGLRIVDLTLYERSECPTNVSSLICAGYKTSPRGTCGGDSGGPLQLLDEDQKYVLIGITSSGIVCASVYFPDFYTDVSQMVPWILKVTRKDSKYCRH